MKPVLSVVEPVSQTLAAHWHGGILRSQVKRSSALASDPLTPAIISQPPLLPAWHIVLWLRVVGLLALFWA